MSLALDFGSSTKNLHFDPNFRDKRSIDDIAEQNGVIASIIMKFIDLWMKLQAANSKDCQRLLLCQLNQEISEENSNSWNLSQVCSLGISKFAARRNETDMKYLLLASEYGRSGLNCSQIYDDCGKNEQRFINYAQLEAWSPVGELKHIRNLVSWVWTKIY